ncbi:hypothetical protein [Micromonospora sp. RP3T]|uniref:hypothetical protein n=1 Tax=Micromonospora sp. RP3T TaxID=2135446 RepID=UPI003D741FBC
MRSSPLDCQSSRLPPTEATVDWWPLDFRLRTDREHVLRWFRHHLYSVTGGPPTRGRQVPLTAVVDADLADRIRRRALSGPTEPRPGFLGEMWTVGQVDGESVWCSPDAPGGSGPGAVVVADGPAYHVIAADDHHVANTSVRVARELLRMCLAQRGALTVHASMAANPRQGGLLFVGGTGAGKTTLAATMARSGGYLVSVDQTEVLAEDGSQPYGVGFPWPARLGVGMLTGMDRDDAVTVLSLLRAQKPVRDGQLTMESRRFRSLDKIELSLLELDTVLGIVTLDRAPINGVVLVETGPPGAPAQIGRSSLADAREHLRGEFREPDPVFDSFWLTPLGHSGPPTGTYDALCAILHDTPFVRLRWRADEHSAEDTLRRVAVALEGEDPDR